MTKLKAALIFLGVLVVLLSVATAIGMIGFIELLLIGIVAILITAFLTRGKDFHLRRTA